MMEIYFDIARGICNAIQFAVIVYIWPSERHVVSFHMSY